MAKNHRSLIRKLFATCHKILLHRKIDPQIATVKGDVLVLGAGFEPYKEMCKQCNSILVTDITDEGDSIDAIADAHNLQFGDGSFDTVVAVEVFEHLNNPYQASKELHRVLRPNGVGLISIPYMFHTHGDPYDYTRFTRWGLENLFSEFTSVEIIEIGGRVHVIADIISTYKKSFAVLRIFNHLLTVPFLLDGVSKDCPSGYVVRVQK